MHRTFSVLVILSLFLSLSPQAADAQAGAVSVTLHHVDASAFPTVTGFVDIFDAQRIFASGLSPESVTVIENGQPFPIDSLTELAIPLQLVVAVNQGPALAAQNLNGFSRFQRAAQVIAQWAESRPADLPDRLSLVSQTGPVINHAGAQEFIVGLNGFNPDMRNARPNLQSLVTAIDVVSAQTPLVGMKRAILFITPQMEDPALAVSLEPLIRRAVQENIRIFVWYVDANTTFTTTSAALFNNLAIQTGGSMFQYSGEERFPDPEAYFIALRRIYLFSYTSSLNASGEHSLIVRAALPTGTADSNELRFELNVQPPNVFPVAPALQITRQAPPDDPFNIELLLPETQEIEIIVEFPDGHPRPLTRTTLYVDGVIADENTSAPFDTFTWDLTGYKISGEHQIVVEAVDTLGLSRASMPIPVLVTVVKPPSGPTAILAKYRTEITFASILLAGLVLFSILLRGRVRIPTPRSIREERRAQTDPLTQPIPALGEEVIPASAAVKTSMRKSKPKKAGSNSKSEMEAAASFVRLGPDGQFAAAAPIPLAEKEIVFGADPVQCTRILDDPSISSVHARLRRTDDGGYLLMDNGSIGGTWVNYDPVGRGGYRLAHGDMVNFGQLTYRFMLKSPPKAAAPKVTFLQNNEE